MHNFLTKPKNSVRRADFIKFRRQINRKLDRQHNMHQQSLKILKQLLSLSLNAKQPVQNETPTPSQTRSKKQQLLESINSHLFKFNSPRKSIRIIVGSTLEGFNKQLDQRNAVLVFDKLLVGPPLETDKLISDVLELSTTYYTISTTTNTSVAINESIFQRISALSSCSSELPIQLGLRKEFTSKRVETLLGTAVLDTSTTNFNTPCPKLPSQEQLVYIFSGKPDFISLTSPSTIEVKPRKSTSVCLSDSDVYVIHESLCRVIASSNLNHGLIKVMSMCTTGLYSWIVMMKRKLLEIPIVLPDGKKILMNEMNECCPTSSN